MVKTFSEKKRKRLGSVIFALVALVFFVLAIFQLGQENYVLCVLAFMVFLGVSALSVYSFRSGSKS